MKKNYFSMVQNGDVATINIYGDITSWAWEELGEVSAYNLSKQLDSLTNVSEINVYINSYGGEVAEGLAIYNALKRKGKQAKVKTFCDGFACSIASVIFMAGTERIMSNASLLMIHNAWTVGQGNADELRKLADDMDIITSASVEAYKERSSLSEKKIKALMSAESWITPKDAVKWGFATEIEEEKTENVSQSVKSKLFDIIMQAENDENDEENDEEDIENDTENDENNDENETKNAENDEENDENDEENVENDGEEEEEDEEKSANERLFGFFEAILKM
jgi:ATP-dependent protease ClpP protease subunit